MADYSTIASGIAASIASASEDGIVEELQHGSKRVRFGRVVEQAQTLAMLNGLAARASGGVCRLAKFQEPQS